MTDSRIAQKITHIRKALGWNQAKLAQIAGITQATISRIESGKVSNPRIVILIKLAKALGTSIDYLVGMDEEIPYNEPKSPTWKFTRHKEKLKLGKCNNSTITSGKIIRGIRIFNIAFWIVRFNK